MKKYQFKILIKKKISIKRFRIKFDRKKKKPHEEIKGEEIIVWGTFRRQNLLLLVLMVLFHNKSLVLLVLNLPLT
jgi:hypothetical protein